MQLQSREAQVGQHGRLGLAFFASGEKVRFSQKSAYAKASFLAFACRIVHNSTCKGLLEMPCMQTKLPGAV
eukprot:NODE_7138_length_586_cov_2.985102_g6138_i0.p6 GENE.NODE_7138_length_586_cov_2.985102_g6138_i0~~NODE_7138_length_586_cov_2.985102_g6138_i0.p6  ORF type:complete len:71 (+),score=2.88 NODE_7138_length_586_cov_2.985102_g6138_i0:158-370(+)